MLADMLAGGEIRPVVAAVFPLTQARQAYEHKPTRGKTVFEIAA
jgi:NADPH:quinone reductase-like Zn-dependent oxidoreductase